MDNKKDTLIIISDLHLSAGYNEETKCYSREEDFFFDNESRCFLEHLESWYQNSERIRQVKY